MRMDKFLFLCVKHRVTRLKNSIQFDLIWRQNHFFVMVQPAPPYPEIRTNKVRYWIPTWVSIILLDLNSGITNGFL